MKQDGTKMQIADLIYIFRYSRISIIALLVVALGIGGIPIRVTTFDVEDLVVDDPMIDQLEYLTKESLGKILNNHSIFKQSLGTSDDAEVYQVMLGCHSVGLFNYGDNLRVYAPFRGIVPLYYINVWNAGRRYSKAYLDSEGEEAIEAEFVLAGGVTEERLIDFLDRFQSEVESYARFRL